MRHEIKETTKEPQEPKKPYQGGGKRKVKVEPEPGQSKRQTTIYLTEQMYRRLALYRLDKRKLNDRRNQVIVEALDRYLTAEGY